MNDTAKDVLADIGRQVRASDREEARRRQTKWDKEHPRLTGVKKGWGKAVGKEVNALGGTLSQEGHKLVADIDRGLMKFFGL